MLVKYVGNNVDILMVPETKIGNTFAESQFSIECFSTPYRLDETTKGREVLFYIRQDIPSNYLKKITVNDESFERFFVQLNLRSKKWFLGYYFEKLFGNNNFSPQQTNHCFGKTMHGL